MKVVHVVRQFAPSVGGLEEAVLKLGLALRGKGIDVAVVTLDRLAKGPATPLPASDTISGLPVTRIPFSGSARYPIAPKVLGHLSDADVVHVHAIDFFFDFLALTRPMHRKPLIASTHGGFFHTDFAQRLKRVYFQTVTRTSARAYRAICASSRSDLHLFRTVAPRNTVLVENGVDTTKWSDLAPSTPLRSLMAIGRFSSNKQIPKLIAILAALRQLHPDWTLTVAGRPWDVSADELRGFAEAAGVAEAVRILPEPDDDAMANAARVSSYIASASRHEGFGISIVEGMAAGMVPVLNRIPAFESLAAEARHGCLFDSDDPKQAAALIEGVHRNGLDNADISRRSCITAAARYSWDAAAELFLQHYHVALGRAPVAAGLALTGVE